MASADTGVRSSWTRLARSEDVRDGAMRSGASTTFRDGIDFGGCPMRARRERRTIESLDLDSSAAAAPVPRIVNPLPSGAPISRPTNRAEIAGRRLNRAAPLTRLRRSC